MKNGFSKSPFGVKTFGAVTIGSGKTQEPSS
jgi:hypothetical protein